MHETGSTAEHENSARLPRLRRSLVGQCGDHFLNVGLTRYLWVRAAAAAGLLWPGRRWRREGGAEPGENLSLRYRAGLRRVPPCKQAVKGALELVAGDRSILISIN